ncbi:MAG TPA: isoprenylcysteine carboxylmethyltransferase family protein [Candidatus Acidoferrum sp.]|nr:isoprenylcysteine carboxylmethyltransferase family protein [Candidatus Acidoferrum sp.]
MLGETAFMIRAGDFEFRNRVWIFAFIFGLPFLFLLVDHVPIGSCLADRLAAAWPMEEITALHIVFGVAALIMIPALLIRVWGSAYLSREVVHDHAVHSEVLHADGPYRHVRNPLYFGNVLMAWAMSFFLPILGWPIVVIGIPLFCYRLIGHEEAALAAEQGESYRAFMNAVPRLWPAIRARIPAGGSKPDWVSGLAAEAFFMSFALGITAFAIFIDIRWFYAGLLASPLFSWLAGLATRKRAKPAGA